MSAATHFHGKNRAAPKANRATVWAGAATVTAALTLGACGEAEIDPVQEYNPPPGTKETPRDESH